jgi:hypothetical protein
MRDGPDLASVEQERTTTGQPTPPTAWTVEVQTANPPLGAYVVVDTTTVPNNSYR